MQEQTVSNDQNIQPPNSSFLHTQMDPNIPYQALPSFNKKTPKQNFWQILAIILLLLLLGTVGVFTYFLQKNNNEQLTVIQATPTPEIVVVSSPAPVAQTASMIPDATSNWITYNGANFTFRYPADWSTVASQVSGDIIGITALAPKNSDAMAINYPPIHLYYRSNPKKLSVPDFQKELSSNTEGMVPIFYTSASKKLNLSGSTGYYLQGVGCEPLLCDMLVIASGDKIYEFVNTYEADIVPAQKTLFEQIISTMRFTN